VEELLNREDNQAGFTLFDISRWGDHYGFSLFLDGHFLVEDSRRSQYHAANILAGESGF